MAPGAAGAWWLLIIPLLFWVRAAVAQVCVGDCNADARVTVDEVIVEVSAILADAPPAPCWDCDTGPFDVPCLVFGVGNLLYGCPTEAVGGIEEW